MINEFTRKQIRYNLYRLKNKTDYTDEMEIVENYFNAVDFDLFAETWDVDKTGLKFVKIKEPIAHTLQPSPTVSIENTATSQFVDITKPINLIMNQEVVDKKEKDFFKKLLKNK